MQMTPSAIPTAAPIPIVVCGISGGMKVHSVVEANNYISAIKYEMLIEVAKTWAKQFRILPMKTLL